jgi:hypothetical protein
MKIDVECGDPMIALVDLHILKYLADFITILGKHQGFESTGKFFPQAG